MSHCELTDSSVMIPCIAPVHSHRTESDTVGGWAPEGKWDGDGPLRMAAGTDQVVIYSMPWDVEVMGLGEKIP